MTTVVATRFMMAAARFVIAACAVAMLYLIFV